MSVVGISTAGISTIKVSAIENAIININLSEVKRILEEEPSLIDERNKDGIAMQFLAAKTGDYELVKYIVEYSRANFNTTDDNHRNTLHYGAMSGNVETCRYLVERVGLSPLTGDSDLVTPIDIAYNNGYSELQKYFEEEIGAPYERLYRNPIRTGMYPDPSIVRVEDNYYMVNSSFIYFPCIPVSVSKDLVHWKIIGYAIADPEWAGLDSLEGGRGYWAPDISYYKGRFYITATYRLNDDGTVYRKQIVVSSDKPEGPYSKPAIIDEDGIDPSIFNDDDGRRYMLLNRGARIFELNESATEQISPARLLYYGDNKRAPEGPHLLKKDGYYYLFEAEGGTGPGHRITVSRSRELMGRYEPCPYNPIMRQQDEGALIQCCGHGKPVQTQNGEWYMVYLCGRKLGEGYSVLGRETALDPITWTAEGWPIVNNLDGPSTLQIKPDLPEHLWETEDCDDFNGDKPGTMWIFPRPPENNGIIIKDSHVFIKGSAKDLSSMGARNIMLRRQQHFNFTAVCKMKLSGIGAGQDAGMTCYYDENTFLKFGVFGLAADNSSSGAVENTDANYTLKLVEYIDKTIEGEAVKVPNGAEYIYLKVDTQGLKRTFSVSYDGVSYENVAVLENVYYLCDEGLKKGKRFTGAMVGMYAYGAGSEMYAAFDRFEYIKL